MITLLPDQLRLGLSPRPHEPGPLRLRVGQPHLNERLRFAGLLQTPLSLGQLGRLGGDLLCHSVQCLASAGRLLTSSFEPATHVSQFLRPCNDGLLSQRDTDRIALTLSPRYRMNWSTYSAPSPFRA